MLRGEIPGFRMDKRYVHKDGSTVWTALNVSLVRDESGTPLYMVSHVSDVSARHRAEMALGESELRLRQAQKMEAVGRLAGGVAHDFNNLLTVIRSNADIGAELAREGTSALDEFNEINAAVERAASLTTQLLAFSRQQVIAPTSLSVNEIVSDSQRMLRRLIGVDVALETRLGEGVGEVVADRGQLEQVLMNLVVNARDAMPDGGRVVISTCRGGEDTVVLSVSDTGTGMDADTLARAFEPFFTTKPLGKGTGLGLSTVYGIAQQSGGDVAIRSEPGSGTTVTMSLPASRPLKAGLTLRPGEAGHQPADPPPEGITILLVEDEPGVRSVVRRILTRFGYRVLEAENGADALSIWMIHRARVRLVLSDAFMPVMGGSEFAQRLRAAGAEVPLLFMSGYPDGERGGGVPQGAELIRKPFTAEQLRDRLEHLLAQAGSAAPRAASPEGTRG
jgi:signal transduction histidine kinase/CheY-like chemotaxis protein